MLAKARPPFVGILHAHHEPQQGRFAGAVWAHKGDPVSSLDLELCTQKQDLLPVAVAEVMDFCGQPARARCIGEAETGPTHGVDRGLDAFDLVEQFLAALGLGGAGGTGPEAVDVGLLGAEFLLLSLEGGLGGLPFQSFLFQVLAVVAQIRA